MTKVITIQINDETTDTQHKFRFNEPSTPAVSSYFSTGAKNLPKASHQLCQDTIVSEDKDLWDEVLKEKPGYALQAANRLLDSLGYGAEAKKI